MQSFYDIHIRTSLAKILTGTPPSELSGECFAERLWGKCWEVLVYDGLHPAIHTSTNGQFVRPEVAQRLIYRAHNYESDIWIRKAASARGMAMKLLLKWQSGEVARFEHSVVGSVNATATVSADDLAALQRQVPSLQGSVVPIGYHFGPPAPFSSSEGPNLLFVGRLDWAPNREGLEWFLRTVWPRIRQLRPEMRLTIAGSGNSSFLGPYLQDPTIRFLGRVPTVEGLYEQATIALVPIFYGSGTRVKAIEASRYARACLSTAVGVEGIGLIPNQSYLRAESVDEWVATLTHLTIPRAQQLGLAAYSHAKSIFDASAAADCFEQLLKDENS